MTDPDPSVLTTEALAREALHYSDRLHDLDQRLSLELKDIQGQVDRRIETQLRERVELEKHLVTRIDALDKLVHAILEEQRRGMQVAEQEREKAAAALRSELARAITEGDERLREHISNQIQQVNAALASGEKLEIQRVQAAEESTRAVQRELTLVQDAAKEAIVKSETSYDKRFEAVNELRGQMQDLILSHQTAINTLTEKLMLREVADAQFADIRQKLDDARSDRDGKLPREVFDRMIAELTTWRAGVDKRLATEAGKERGTNERRILSTTATQLTLARGGLVVAVIGLVVTVILAANGTFS